MNEIVKTVSSSTYMNGNRYTLSTDKDTTTKTIEYVVYYWDNDKESKGLDTVNLHTIENIFPIIRA
jgi:hypothetical protein